MNSLTQIQNSSQTKEFDALSFEIERADLFSKSTSMSVEASAIIRHYAIERKSEKAI